MLGTRQLQKHLIESVIQKFHKKNTDFFFDDFQGDDHPLILGIKNLFFPERLLTKLAYDQIFSLPRPFSKALSFKPTLTSEQVGQAIAELRSDGITKLPVYAPEVAKIISDSLEIKADEKIHSAGYSRKLDFTFSAPAILEYLTDLPLLNILGGYLNAQPFLRTIPGVSQSFPNNNYQDLLKINNSGTLKDTDYFNLKWHFDTVNLVNVHLLLNDVSSSGTRMLYAKKSHKKHHLNLGPRDYHYSENFVRSKYEVVDCSGLAGTVIIFDANGLHRMHPVKDSFRAMYCHLVTPGNDLHINGSLKYSNSAFEKLNALQRTFIGHAVTHQ